ncbi:MAG: glycosyltransferase [Azospirillum sp.]|nr:glycosyltransferase [Azospirillum sp.]
MEYSVSTLAGKAPAARHTGFPGPHGMGFPGSLVIADDGSIAADNPGIVQLCQMLSAFGRVARRVTFAWADDGRMAPSLQNLPVKLHPIACREGDGSRRTVDFVLRLMPWLYRTANSVPLLVTRNLGVALAAQAFVPRVLLELRHEPSNTARRLLPLLGRRVRIATVSNRLREHLIEAYGFRPKRVSTCHDGADFCRFAAAEPLPTNCRPVPQMYGSFIHLCYGLPSPGAGLSAIRYAAESLPDHGFVVAGGSGEEVAEARRASFDLPNVHLTPAVAPDDVPRLLRSYSSVLLPHHETGAAERWMVPPRLFEVLSSGMPAVVNSQAPVTEVVGSEHVNFFDGSQPHSLVAALLRLQADLPRARIRAAAAQHLAAERFTWDQRAQRMIAFGAADAPLRPRRTPHYQTP